MLLVLSGCSGSTPPVEPDAPPEESSPGHSIHYEVRLRDGGSAPFTATFTSPTGTVSTFEGSTPWASETEDFQDGSMLSLQAEISHEQKSPLLCNLVDDGGGGSWTMGQMGDPIDACAVTYTLGLWPPDDNDLSSPLIRDG
ncbi:MAG: hypothetical protein WD004_05695 [Actinomycetota bacterium]